jgi:zinc D-Ala-D-Ala carboxypeptidase
MTTKHHSRVQPSEWPYKYFTPAEIACRGTGLVMLNSASHAALDKLDRLRGMMGHPLIVSSGYRSPGHNKAVGGATQSKHMEGTAFDILMLNVDPHKFEAAAKKVGFNGIGIYPPQKSAGAKNFIHIDTRSAPKRWAEWGEFPRRATRFAPEPEATPVKDATRDVVPVTGIGAVAVAVEPALREVAPWLPEHMQSYVMIAAVVLGLALVVWRMRGRRDV